MRISKIDSAAFLLLCFSLMVGSTVRADGTNDYSYQSGGNTFTWQLPTNPVITQGNSDPGNYFTISDWSFLENGAAMTGTLDYFNTNLGGGFDIWTGSSDLLIDAYGSQLYTGPEDAPTLLTGTFFFTDYGNTTIPTYGTSLQSTSVPEPSTFALLSIGAAFGLTIFLIRRS